MDTSPLSPELLEKTLEELDGQHWGEPPYSSEVVRQCYVLRKKKLKDFSIEDMRLSIGQERGLEYLIPLAINELERDILAEGDYYPGDLLCSVLRIDKQFWQKHKELRALLVTLLKSSDLSPLFTIPSFKEDKERFEREGERSLG